MPRALLMEKYGIPFVGFLSPVAVSFVSRNRLGTSYLLDGGANPESLQQTAAQTSANQAYVSRFFIDDGALSIRRSSTKHLGSQVVVFFNICERKLSLRALLREKHRIRLDFDLFA